MNYLDIKITTKNSTHFCKLKHCHKNNCIYLCIGQILETNISGVNLYRNNDFVIQIGRTKSTFNFKKYNNDFHDHKLRVKLYTNISVNILKNFNCFHRRWFKL